MTDDDIKLHPAWREAEKVLLEEGLTYGKTVDEDHLRDLLGLRTPRTIAEYEKDRFAWLQQFEPLCLSLLENHQMMLARVPDVGYMVVDPAKQTTLSRRKRGREIALALRKMERELRCVNATLLTDAERKDNTDAIAKLGILRSVSRKQLRGPK